MNALYFVHTWRGFYISIVNVHSADVVSDVAKSALMKAILLQMCLGLQLNCVCVCVGGGGGGLL